MAIKFRYTEISRVHMVKEYEVTDLSGYNISEDQLKSFLSDPDSADSEVEDAVREMLDDVEYEIVDEGEQFGGEEWQLV
jgi:hypothetical protein